MNKILAASGLFFTLISLISPTQAEENQKPPQKPDFIKTVDKNNDGKASKAEFFAAMEKKFHSMDVDKSEVVSVQELKLYGEKDPEARKKMQQALKATEKPEIIPDKALSEEAFSQKFTDRAEREFSMLDKNHDNELTANELDVSKVPQKKTAHPRPAIEKRIPKEDFIALFTESADRHFAELDKNYDGELSHDELGMPKPMPAVKPKAELAPPAVQTPAKPKPQLDEKMVRKQKFIKSFFVGIDANNDGQISTPEKTAAFERLFNRLDTNHDQFITFDEIIAGRQIPSLNKP